MLAAILSHAANQSGLRADWAQKSDSVKLLKTMVARDWNRRRQPFQGWIQRNLSCCLYSLYESEGITNDATNWHHNGPRIDTIAHVRQRSALPMAKYRT